MKRIISMLISIILVAGIFTGCVGSAGNGNNRIGGSKQASYDLNKVDSSLTDGNEIFAFDIFKELNTEDADKNIFISPLSISTALAMTYNGAGSTTKEAMAEALRYRGIELENLNTGYKNLLAYLTNVDPKVQLNISNSIWFRIGEEIKQDFLSVNKDNFNAYITEMDFQDSKAADTINGWISKATKGKIDKMIEPPISHDVIMYLINAIYFKGQWTKQFDKKLTFTGTFNTEDGQKKEVQMMHRKGKIEYGEVEKSKIVRLPYGNEKTAMYCILPETGIKINDFIQQLSVEKWIELKDSLSKVDDVVLQLPKFKMEYGIKNLNDSLTALGMGEAFSDSADFSGIRDDICISRVLHKAVIEVNEEGSEAAGATVVEMKETAAVEPVTFIGDRPFIFIIADDETGSILFMGKFME